MRAVKNSVAAQPRYFTEKFSDAKPVGKVVGSVSPVGVLRRGADAEGVISIDHGGIRIQPILNPGWGKEGVVYGPYQRQNGLAFAILLLNGHNASQTGKVERYDLRLRRWIKGSGTDSRWQRILRWPGSMQRSGIMRRLVWWLRESLRTINSVEVKENLATGWFDKEVPQEPLGSGNLFVMHSIGPENGELWVNIGRRMLPVVRGVQNLPLYLVIVLREEGAAYYCASLPNAKDCAPYPEMRLLAIDPFQREPELYAGLYQSILGEIGFKVDTRVFGARVEHVPDWERWYGSAHAADTLTGSGSLAQDPSEIGGEWKIIEGSMLRTPDGVRSDSRMSSASLFPETMSGLVHVLVQVPAEGYAEAGLLFRCQDAEYGWRFLASSKGCQAQIRTGAEWQDCAVSDRVRLINGCTHSLQVLDNGKELNFYLDGQPAFQSTILDTRYSYACGVGITSSGDSGELYLRNFEAHPRKLNVPDCLSLDFTQIGAGNRSMITDEFTGEPGDLNGHQGSEGLSWRKEIGKGRMLLTGEDSVRVDADITRHNPGRLAYTIPWMQPGFADVSVWITPPGTARNQGEKGRGGLIFWQDPENYLVINNWLDDIFDGSSISSFYHLHGYEEIYDAVWSNVGSRIFWGKPHKLGAIFDGMRILVSLDDEPVLYRSLTDIYPTAERLNISRVGIAANWEWGDDTGTIFKRFSASVKS